MLKDLAHQLYRALRLSQCWCWYKGYGESAALVHECSRCIGIAAYEREYPDRKVDTPVKPA